MSRILLIEDDQEVHEVLRIMLEKSGHEVVVAEEGRQGLLAYKAQPIDLVITDLIMPEMEGMEVIRALRQLSATLPIIAISGGGRATPENYLTIAKHFGASEVFAKPFELGVFSAVVEKLLGK